MLSEYSTEPLYQWANIAKSLQHNVRPLFALGLLCFCSKVWMYLGCSQKQKAW